ncbi:MAG: hypothetical protein EZS28_025054 [Streblomastix strix]|uniref:Uncharacterized protein n=1 Tax=Streblomastix strix TaxID=222440 RepID=A0A5J4VAD9_9EUKA|nr:MAG: hypothetical protein EZS28_025054 [Streblomastix strix]
MDAPTSCPSLWVGHVKTKKAKLDASQDHSKSARQFSGLDTLQTHIWGANSSHTVDLPVAQLDLDVFKSDRQLAPTVATCAQIQCTASLPLVQRQIAQILEGTIQTSLQETDFYATNTPNTQVLEVIQRATRVPLLLQHTEKPTADIQLLPPHSTIDSYSSSFQLLALQFQELGLLTVQRIFEGNLSEALNNVVSAIVLAFRQTERTNITRIRLFSRINPPFI